MIVLIELTYRFITSVPRTTSVNLDLDFDKVSHRIQNFISSYVLQASSNGLIIGLSGGLDSSVVLKLCVNALGTSRVIGLMMPSDKTPQEDTDHAIELAKKLGIKYHMIDINAVLDKYGQALPENKRARGNLMARIRMNILYYYAGINCYLVAGTSDKSELCMGYFTKFGDGAADIMPIAHLYKTQVRALAKHLGIPNVIVEKKSSPRLWDNHLAEEEIGMDYEMIDTILNMLVDRKLSLNDVARKIKISTTQVNKISSLMKRNLHKRTPIPISQLKT